VSQPPAYIPAHSFVSDSAILANFPGQALDVEFQDIKTTTDAIRANLALIQRDDGGLANGIVTYDSLAASLQTNGLAPANFWVTGVAYGTGITVYQNGNLYRCAIAHTAGVFATDLAAGKWTFVVGLPAGSQGPAGTITVNNTTTLAAGAPATVTNVGTAQAASLNFGIPQGTQGVTGAPGAGYGGVSATSFTVGTGSKAFTTQAGLAYQVGNYVRASSAANGANYMEGPVTAYSGTTLTINVTKIGGSGTLNDWAFAVSGAPGAGDLISTNNLSDVSNAGTARSNLGLAIGTNVQAFDAQLFSNIPQNSKSAAYTTVLTDAQKHIFHPSADTTARTFTIDSNANVPYPIGTAITFINQHSAGVVTIAITTDTMRLAGPGTTGNRTLAADGVATAIKVTSTEWIISGTGLT
jgi:hypothetical protein